MRSESEIAIHLGELKALLEKRTEEGNHQAALTIAAKIDLLNWILEITPR